MPLGGLAPTLHVLAISQEGLSPSKLISIHLTLWTSAGIFSVAGDVRWMEFSTEATTSGSERHSYDCNATTDLTQLIKRGLMPNELRPATSRAHSLLAGTWV
jgi:hypothetical protein